MAVPPSKIHKKECSSLIFLRNGTKFRNTVAILNSSISMLSEKSFSYLQNVESRLPTFFVIYFSKICVHSCGWMQSHSVQEGTPEDGNSWWPRGDLRHRRHAHSRRLWWTGRTARIRSRSHTEVHRGWRKRWVTSRVTTAVTMAIRKDAEIRSVGLTFIYVVFKSNISSGDAFMDLRSSWLHRTYMSS